MTFVGVDLGDPAGDWTAVVTQLNGDIIAARIIDAPELATRFHEIRMVFDAPAEQVRAFMRAIGRVRWSAIRADYEAHGRTRSDGRPRRSGHRHRGTPAWRRRHG